MIRVIAETRIIWRSEAGRRGRLTRLAAYRDAAWHAWRAAHPCSCEHETGFRCGNHVGYEETLVEGGQIVEQGGPDAYTVHMRAVVARLARWLMWRDSAMAAEGASALSPCLRELREARP